MIGEQKRIRRIRSQPVEGIVGVLCFCGRLVRLFVSFGFRDNSLLWNECCRAHWIEGNGIGSTLFMGCRIRGQKVKGREINVGIFTEAAKAAAGGIIFGDHGVA